MMKRIVFSIALLTIPALADAQIDEKKRESAMFQVNRYGLAAFYTDIAALNVPFMEEQAADISNDMMEKEEIFGVELINGAKTLRVYHLSTLNLNDVKSFVLPYTSNIHVEESVPYDF